MSDSSTISSKHLETPGTIAQLTPRGAAAALPHGGLPELISPYMQKLISSTGGAEGPIGKQFIANIPEEHKGANSGEIDIQEEHIYEAAPGVIYKYKGSFNPDGSVLYHGRILWTISRFCATYCRFCFRGRVVGLPGNVTASTGETIGHKPYLSEEDIHQVIQFITNNPEINEVILSGGDPLIAPEHYLTSIIEQITALPQIQIIRIHTRAPVTNPVSIRPWHYTALKKIPMPYIVLHINHPAELTPEVLEIANRLRTECGAILMSQSVLLKGVNDSVETLYELFTALARHGIHPYYLHYTDPVYWAASFTVPFKKAVHIWQTLRKRLSGVASTAKFVIDTPYGKGKVTVPDAEWAADMSTFSDFDGTKVSVSDAV